MNTVERYWNTYMPTSLTRFELQIPIYDNISQPTQYNAVRTFLTGLQGLTTYIASNGYVNGSSPEVLIVYGLITTAQQAAALNLLTTLNASLAAAGSPAILCTIHTVTSEP